MTRKDYVLIARVIRRAWDANSCDCGCCDEIRDHIHYTVAMFIDEFEASMNDPRFDAERFRAACLGEGETRR